MSEVGDPSRHEPKALQRGREIDGKDSVRFEEDKHKIEVNAGADRITERLAPDIFTGH